MRLVQYRTPSGARAVAAVDDGGRATCVDDTESIYEMALAAIEEKTSIAAVAAARRTSDGVDLDAVDRDGRFLTPLDHPVPTRCWITGTGLTHLGSAEARSKMHDKTHDKTHDKIGASEDSLTDSMRMFKWGVEGGKPAAGEIGVQPEWFFKGNGSSLVPPGKPLPLPEFAGDGGEEPEIVGCYVIAEDGTPCRVGFVVGNEFTDHATERKNYLYLAHSKLRACSVGPELLLGALPDDVRGSSRIVREGKAVWEKPFITGEANMSHTLANLEFHHFKYPIFRRPGDVHLHFFGTSTMSFLDGFATQPGDVFEIEVGIFGRTLRNPLEKARWGIGPVRVL